MGPDAKLAAEALTGGGNYAAIAGEGAALVERGALAKARLNLAKLESLCGAGCTETQALAAVIATHPGERVLRAEAVWSAMWPAFRCRR